MPVLSTVGAAMPRRLTATVPREYVHRAAVAEVLLTGWQQAGGSFTLTAQWPRGHSFFIPLSGPRYDPLIIAETVRQVGLLLAHTEFGVPMDYQFLMRELGFTANPEALGLGPAPAELDLAVTCSDIGRTGRHISGMRYRVDILQNGHEIAVGSAWFACTSSAVYRRLRGERALPSGARAPGEPVHPSLVGRVHAADVVLAVAEDACSADSRRRWLLRINHAHPVLFDHPVDHVPGMLLLEAARQAGLAACSPVQVIPVSLHTTFQKYAESDQPCWIEAAEATTSRCGDIQITVTGQQAGEPVFTAQLTVRPL